MRFRWLSCVLMIAAGAVSLYGDTGVLIPRDATQPDPAVLSLQEMRVDIRIDNGDARVWVKQIFLNHTGKIEEGDYVFALPSEGSVSDFAVWDGPVRIPAVVLERKRAGEIYADLRAEAIDPGLLQQGERTEGSARQNAVFSAQIVPIQPWGTKRLEMEYHQTIPVDDFQSHFVLPLRPTAYQMQTVGRLHIHFELHSTEAVGNFAEASTEFPLKMVRQDAHTIEGDFDGANVSLKEDLAASWKVDAAGANRLNVITYRNPKAAQPAPDEIAPEKNATQPGFFEASALIAPEATKMATAARTPRNVIVLFDDSLSMQWEKLQRSYAAMAKVLNALAPQDRFNLILFNTKVQEFSPVPVEADRTAVNKAVEFVRASHLRGGTDIQGALEAGLAQCSMPDSALILITDGGTNSGTIQAGNLSAWYAARWKALPTERRPQTDVFSVGDDANLPLLRMLSNGRGVMESVLSTEPVDYKLDAFLAKLVTSPLEGVGFRADPASTVQLVYPLNDAVYAGSVASWVGKYEKPQKSVAMVMEGVDAGHPFELKSSSALPEEALEHPELPRLWAKARVDALLDEIARDGETEARVDEVIRLARKYKFVTPYTSFLAVPRALLRPRVIRPGDPVLRVHTDPSIVSVIALFPFGLTKPLRYLRDGDVWETRFLAPTDMKDGTYSVRLILRDRAGHSYREAKTFVIASTPPVVHVHLEHKRFRAGDVVALRVSASRSTRTLTARLTDMAPVSLRWNASAGASTGAMSLPADLPPGDYTLTVTAEDIAHNLGSEEVRIEVVP